MIHFDIGGKPSIQFSLPSLRVSPGGSGGGNVSSAQINTIAVLDRAEFDALAVKDAKTLYLIRG
jgi:hypothetical protein|nr:MAG TPA: hypothetical protein [Caudoviricetes sp.]